jgi:hypothetical protein
MTLKFWMKKETWCQKCSSKRILNVASSIGDRGGSRVVTYHDPTIQRGAARGVKAGRHVTGVYATSLMVKHFLRFTSSTLVQNRTRIFASTLNGLSASHQLEAGSVVQLWLSLSVSMQYDREVVWMKSC